MLMSRFKVAKKRTLDGRGYASKFFELIPIDSKGSSLSTDDEECMGKLHAHPKGYRHGAPLLFV